MEIRPRIPYLILSLSTTCIIVHTMISLSDRYHSHVILLSSPKNEQMLAVSSLYRYVTHSFVHGSWKHLYNNMLTVLLFGSVVECLYPRRLILTAVLVTIIVTPVINAFVGTHSIIGFSGAACTLMGLLLGTVLDKETRDILLPVYVLIVGMVLLDILFMTTSLSYNIAHHAHLTGYAIGTIIGVIAILRKRSGYVI